MERFSVESNVGGYHVYKARTPLVLAYLNERYWPRFLVVLLPCSLLCSLPPSTHVGQLEKGDPTDHRYCQQGQVVKKSRTLARVDRAAVYVWVEISWVENFVTPGLTMKITKISTPRK